MASSRKQQAYAEYCRLLDEYIGRPHYYPLSYQPSLAHFEGRIRDLKLAFTLRDKGFRLAADLAALNGWSLDMLRDGGLFDDECLCVLPEQVCSACKKVGASGSEELPY